MDFDPALTCFDHLSWFHPLAYPLPEHALPAKLPTELGLVLEAQRHRTERETHFAIRLSEDGQAKIWRQYFHELQGELPRRRRATLRLALESAIALAGSVGLAQAAVKRAKRPYEVDASIERLGPKPTGSSFPSGHGATAYAAATVLTHYLPARSDLFHRAAENVGRARIYAGAHFPGDVAAGARLGVAAARRLLLERR